MGQHVVRRIIALLGRASIIIFILALTIFISAICLGTSTSILTQAFRRNIFSFFSPHLFPINICQISCRRGRYLEHGREDDKSGVHGIREPLQTVLEHLDHVHVSDEHRPSSPNKISLCLLNHIASVELRSRRAIWIVFCTIKWSIHHVLFDSSSK